MDEDEIRRVLEAHAAYLRCEGGERADLEGAELSDTIPADGEGF